MRFAAPLVPARLLRRYKRFLADVVLETGEETTVHCANPGAMLGLTAQGNRVWLSRSPNPDRKLPWSWELVEAEFGAGPVLVGINTGHPNAVAAETVAAGMLPDLANYASLRREVKYGRNSSIDLLLEGNGRPPCYVEVKNTHLFRQAGLVEFPDCVTERGTKHLGELARMAAAGARACMLYLVQADFARRFALAADLDPNYFKAFAKARAAGVEAFALCCKVSTDDIAGSLALPVEDLE